MPLADVNGDIATIYHIGIVISFADVKCMRIRAIISETENENHHVFSQIYGLGDFALLRVALAREPIITNKPLSV